MSGAQSAFRTYTWRVSRYDPPAATQWLPGVAGALGFRDDRSSERIGWPSVWHRFGACIVGRYVPIGAQCIVHRWRPYRVECTGPLPTSEVKRRRARLVLGWGTAREDLRVLPAFISALYLPACLHFRLLACMPACMRACPPACVPDEAEFWFLASTAATGHTLSSLWFWKRHFFHSRSLSTRSNPYFR